MNNAEAKFILQGYRSNGTDATDATFKAALEQAQKDPALAEWFAKQQAFDAAVSAKLGQISAPTDLRASILAGGRVTAADTPARKWWNRPSWMAMAAGVAVMFAAGLALWPKQASAINEFALADAELSSTHGGMGGPIDNLQAVLSQPTTKLGQKLPVDYAALHGTGCRTVAFQGRDVLEVCFSRNGTWFHCYIAKAGDFPGLALGTTPTVVDKGTAAIASWVDSGQLIVVVSKTGRKSLEALL